MAETTIPLSKATRDRLRALGAKGETYDAILNRLMGRAGCEEFMERQHRRLGEKEKFVPLDEI
ncbi:MAG: hypothetical protein QXO51_08505 [Halobacteria archaeon]